MEKIHIALAVCDPKGTYTQHAAVTIASVFANTKTQICIHFLHDETLTEDNKNKLIELADNFQQDIEFINVDSYLAESKIDISKLSTDGFKGTVFRLLLPELSDADKMIYLDCDIIVTMDIAELWNIDLLGKAIAVVPDVYALNYVESKKGWPKSNGKIWDSFGLKREEYFNAGVLLLNLKRIREDYDFLKEIEHFYGKYKEVILFADQDCLNYVFATDKLIIAERFNRIRTNVNTKDGIFNSIWHMAARKPWEDYTRPGLDELYWKYLRMTPYCKNEDELITIMFKTLTSSRFCHKHSVDCIQRLKKQLKENLVKGYIKLLRLFWGSQNK